jgi:TonB family protein
LGLDTEDLAIFNKFFLKQYQVALLAKPFATKPTAGAIFIREGSSLRSETSYNEFPFLTSTVERKGASVASLKGGEKVSPALASNPRTGQPFVVGRAAVIGRESRGSVIAPLLQAEAPGPTAPEIPAETIATPAQARALTAPPELQPDASPDQITPQRTVENTGWALKFETAVKPICIAVSGKLEATTRRMRPMWIAASAELAAAVRAARPRWIAGASAAALALLSGLLFFPGLHLTKRPATPSSRNASTLSFRVERSAGELLVTWNRDADVIHEATHAILAIADGERHQSVDLDQAQLRHGGIVYLPSNSEINFQLTVMGRKAWQTQSESVRVLRVSPWATPEPPQASPPKPVPARTRAANTLPLRSSKASKGPGAELVKALNEAAPQVDDLAQSSGSASALDLPDAPVLTSGPQAQAVLIPSNMASPAEALVSLFRILVTAPRDIPEPKIGGRVSAAQILTQRSPEYPLSARQARVQGSVVVRAVIGVDGHVKLAKAVSGPPVLQNAAVSAVRRWVYKPATLNATAVESETRIELHFKL